MSLEDKISRFARRIDERLTEVNAQLASEQIEVSALVSDLDLDERS
jgi:hypothetical protein